LGTEHKVFGSHGYRFAATWQRIVSGNYLGIASKEHA
jgi:hypothetical protein